MATLVDQLNLNRCDMDKLEELLPGIENFLRNILAKESLSKLAEKQRQYYVERLDVIQLPPHLPPKPDGGEKTLMQGRKLPEPVKNKSSEDFIAHQRAISRQALSGSEPQSTTCEDNPVPNNGLGIDSDQYEDGLYEEPVAMESNPTVLSSQLPAGPSAAKFDLDSDADSSTSYESYDEPDVEETYNNVGYDGQLKADIPLPRLKTKRKKKATSINDRYYKQLHGIVVEGELYHRGKVAFTSAWTKRYCAICDGIFYCYKDKESKPVFSVPLLGYDVILQEREKGRCNVLRLSQPGSETHFISTDSPSETQAWMNKIEPLCYSNSADVQEDSKSTDRTGSISSMELYTEGPGSAVANGSPNLKNRKVTGTLSSDGKRDKKGKFGKLFSGTFGKKKGRQAVHHLEISEGSPLDRNLMVSPDNTFSGVVKLLSPALLNSDSWQYKNCTIKNGVFECYKDDSTSSDLDFSVLLNDHELVAHDKNSLSIAVTKKDGETAFIIEPEDTLKQGDWLSALLKHVGNGPISGADSNDVDDMTYTYVDSHSIGSVPSDNIEVHSLALSLDASEDSRQYADLSDKQSDSDSSEGGGDTYDEPPVEAGDRQSKLYEEVADTCSPSSSLAPSNRSSALLTQAEAVPESPAIDPTYAVFDDVDTMKKEEVTVTSNSPPNSPPIDETNRQTRVDIKTKADTMSSPTPSTESNRPSFSRESSCSSEGNSRKLSETIAKNRALFENNSSSGSGGTTGKWSGYKLAGASSSPSNVKRTPSLSSTASTRSTPNSAASSPKNPRANLVGAGNVDRYKAAFEARESNNNTIIDKQVSPTIPSLKLPSDFTKLGNKKVGTRISPIRVTTEREEDTPPPKFTSIFNVQTTASGSKPTRLEIKSVTPSPYSGNDNSSSSDDRLCIDTALRFDIDLSSDSTVTVIPASNFESSTKNGSTVLSTSPAKPALILTNTSPCVSPRLVERSLPAVSGSGASKASAKNFLTSALQKLATEDSSRKLSANGSITFSSTSYSNEEEELKRLEARRKSLRKKRQIARDQKLSTVLPEDIERLDSEYKRIDSEYKTTDKQIKMLEERKLQRIKDSISRRRSESLTGKKKLWEGSS